MPEARLQHDAAAPAKTQPVRKDRLFKATARQLGWYAIIAMGIEDGAWLKIAVTNDIEAVEKNGQVHHADDYCARVVFWTADRLFAEMVRDQLFEIASAQAQLIRKSFVAMPVAGCRAAIVEAAARAQVQIKSQAEYDALVDARIRNAMR